VNVSDFCWGRRNSEWLAVACTFVIGGEHERVEIISLLLFIVVVCRRMAKCLIVRL
jgi:hypothetical protein